MPTQDLALLADELTRQQLAVQAVGVDFEPVHVVVAVGSAPVIDVDRVAAAVVEVADDLTDLWFVDADGLLDSEEPAHVAYEDEPMTSSSAQPMRFVLLLACVMLAVAACVGATV